MKKIVQKTDTLLESLCTLETDWQDDFSNRVIQFLEKLEKPDTPLSDTDEPPEWELFPETEPSGNPLTVLLDADFDAASTVFRLFLEKSNDEYKSVLKELMPEKGMSGAKGFRKDKGSYVQKLNSLNLEEIMQATMERKYTWQDIIIERLKAGRGSAIKGQKRGRQLEDFVETAVAEVFENYDARCSFTGMSGDSTEKADFAIPSKENPEIIIEVKGYGATGSKQTDVIGDISRIIQEKRHDSTFLIFTDGVTWKERESDFRKLVAYQNQGYIYRIYTKAMRREFLEDLRLLKEEKNL